MNLRVGLIPDLRETAARLPGLMEQARREGFALSGAEITEEPLPPDQNAAVILEEVGESLWPYAAEFRAFDPSDEAQAALERALSRLPEAATRPSFRFRQDSDLIWLKSLGLMRRQMVIYRGIKWKLSNLNWHDPERTELALTLDQVAAWVGSDPTLSMAELSCSCALAAREALTAGAQWGQPAPELPAWQPNLRRLIGHSILYTMGLRRCCRLPQLSRVDLVERMPLHLAKRFDRPVSLAPGDAVREGLPPDAWAQARAARELEMLLSILPMIDAGAGAAAVFDAFGQQARRMARSWRASEAGGGACIARRRLHVTFVGQAMGCRVHEAALEAFRTRDRTGHFPKSLPESDTGCERGYSMEYASDGEELRLLGWLSPQPDLNALAFPALAIDRTGWEMRGSYGIHSRSAPQ